MGFNSGFKGLMSEARVPIDMKRENLKSEVEVMVQIWHHIPLRKDMCIYFMLIKWREKKGMSLGEIIWNQHILPNRRVIWNFNKHGMLYWPQTVSSIIQNSICEGESNYEAILSMFTPTASPAHTVRCLWWYYYAVTPTVKFRFSQSASNKNYCFLLFN